jgi:hypothetical protein
MISTVEQEISGCESKDVEQYLLLGHFGYILEYRKNHGGNDPDSGLLDRLARLADEEKPNLATRMAVGFINLLG